jgi:serine/threonine protein kinase
MVFAARRERLPARRTRGKRRLGSNGQAMIGLKIGSYQILRKLGSGTSATAYLARDSRGRHAVAKRLRDPLAANPAIVQRFLAAAEASGRIRIRKNVATVLVRRTSAEGVLLLRQYVEGRPLSDYIRAGKLGELDGNRLARDICDGLRAMASRDVVHGGIHPGNVIVGPDGRAKLTDFGTSLAYLIGKAPRAYPPDALRYLAPEQWRGEKGTTLSDIYSAGVMIALLDYGKAVFDGRDYAQLKTQVLAGRKESCPVLAAALDANPARRYPTVDKLRERLASRAGATRKPKAAEPKPARGEKPKRAKPGTQAARPRPKRARPPSTRPAQPAPGQAGWLSSLIDRVAGRDLLETVPPKPWIVPRSDARQQRPLRAANGGPGELQLSVSWVGQGVSASPNQVVIPAGRASWIVVNVEPDSDMFANLLFRWRQGKTEKRVVIKVVRSD